MSIVVHMATYALNPKLCVDWLGRVPPIDDQEVKDKFLGTITKVFTYNEGMIVCEKFLYL